MGFSVIDEQSLRHPSEPKTAPPRLDFVESGMRYYNSAIGRWISRDPIGEDGGLNLYGVVGNEPVGRWDLLGEKTMPSVKRAHGLTVSGLAGLGGPFAHFSAGKGVAIIFFPATCEVATFSLAAGLGKNYDEWRPITKDDFKNNHKDWLDFQGGLAAGVGVGAEHALYLGSDIANADSFNGIFESAQGSVGIVTASEYTAADGNWAGVTMTFGPGVGVIKVDWLYTEQMNIDLDDDWGDAGRCICAGLRAKVGISLTDAFLTYF